MFERIGAATPTLPLAAALVMFLLLGALGPEAAFGQGRVVGAYYWYVPEHERYGRTEFYSEPSFKSSTVRIIRTQRFRLQGAPRKGWALLEFDVAGKTYLHVRLLDTLIYNPTTTDPWTEFRRASVFPEDPEKIEARLKAPATPTSATPTPSATDSKIPSWRRYKDSWGIKAGRPAPVVSEDPGSDSTHRPSRPTLNNPVSKPRSKYPLLPPLGSEPPPEASPDVPGQDAEGAAQPSG